VKRAYIIVEGQTEERFVKDILGPHLEQLSLYLKPIIVTTKVVKDGPNFKGGLCNFTKFQRDVRKLLHGSGGALVTTMVDYYALPVDFPGMDSKPMHLSPVERVTHLENALSDHFMPHQNFMPFVALHEFEAWLFTDAVTLPSVMSLPNANLEFKQIALLAPEDINDHPDTAPSKRLKRLYPNYRKTLHGPIALGLIGLPAIRARCPHFSQWLGQLEGYAAD
jgi:hypothetical protein